MGAMSLVPQGGDTNLYGYVVNNPINFFDPHGLAPDWVGPTSVVAGATGGTLLGIGIATGNPIAGGVGLGLVAVAGGLQLWDVATSPEEKINAIKNSEDMKQIQDNIRNLQDLLDETNGQKKDDNSCPMI